MKSYNQFVAESNAGTYIGVRFTEESVSKLVDLCEMLGIENRLPDNKFHSTVMYDESNTLTTKEESNFTKQSGFYVDAIPEPFNINDDGSTVVLKLVSKDLEKLHELAKSFGLEFSYDEYLPHVTLSYDSEIPSDRIRSKPIRLEVSEVYVTDLIKDWKEK